MADGRFGVIEYRAFPRMHVIQGSGVGGGSLHYFNVHITPPASVFEDQRWPREVTFARLEPYYELARDMLDAGPLEPPVGRALPTRTAVFLEACQSIGRPGELVPIAVHTGAPQANPHGGVAQLPCDYSGNCALGCATQAKNAMDVTYLPLAEGHGAEILPLHTVELIEPVGRRGYRVKFLRRDPKDPRRTEKGVIDAQAVVVAAGTLGTNELLLRCRDAGALPDLSPALGRGFSGNGDLLLAATLTDRDVDPSWGPSITAGADFSSETHRAYIEDLGYPGLVFWFVEGMLASATLPLSPARIYRLLKLFAYDRLALKGAAERISAEREDLFGGGPTRRLLPYLGMCEDSADGEFVLDGDGQLDLRWNPAASRERFFELEAGMRELSEALGGPYLSSPLWDPPTRELLTAHPLGGCVMADDPERGVVDPRGAVYGYPGLFVADASVIATPLARNPSATISALAERTAFHMLHDREIRRDELAAPK